VTRGVSIVIPTWNGLDLLKRFLPTVIEAAIQYAKQTGAPTQIIIVDDGGVDDSVEWLRGQGFVEGREGAKGGVGEEETGRRGDGTSGRGGEWATRRGSEGETGRGGDGQMEGDPLSDQCAPSLKLIRNEINRGFGEACNRGFEAAGYPLVFLLNNDVEVDVNSIVPLVENFADPSVFAAHCRVFELSSGRECGTGKLGSFARGFIRVHRSYVPSSGKVEGQAEHGALGSHAPLYSMFAGGGSAMFDREKFIEIGGFEPLLSPFYWEDVELSYRAWKRGYTVLYEPRSVTRHRVSSTISKLDQRAVRKVEQRNRLIYHWIHLHERSMMVSHVLWVLLLAVTAPLRPKPAFISSCVAALKRLPEIRKRRLEEKRAARRSDRDVFDLFGSLERRADVFAYDDYSELEETGPGLASKAQLGGHHR
jgi:GT2 family glycosyltransferase